MLEIKVGQVIQWRSELIAVVTIEHDPVSAIILENGDRLSVTEVFDCSVYTRRELTMSDLVVGDEFLAQNQARKIKSITITEPSVTIYTHEGTVVVGNSKDAVSILIKTHNPELKSTNINESPLSETSRVDGFNVSHSVLMDTFTGEIESEYDDESVPSTSSASTSTEKNTEYLVVTLLSVLGIWFLIIFGIGYSAIATWDFVSKNVFGNNSSGISDEQIAKWNAERQANIDSRPPLQLPRYTTPPKTSFTCRTTDNIIGSTTVCD
jgi:hypothetical protein